MSRTLWIVGLALVALALALVLAGVAEPVALAVAFVGGAVNLVAAVSGAMQRHRSR